MTPVTPKEWWPACEVAKVRPHGHQMGRMNGVTALNRQRDGKTTALNVAQVAEQLVIELTIVLLPGFSQLSLSSLIEPLHIANTLAAHVHFKWRLVGQESGSITSASGFEVAVSSTVDEEKKRIMNRLPSRVFICAGDGVEKYIDPALLSLVRACLRMRIPIAALGTATFVLAQAGILADTRCTIYWPQIVALSGRFSRINVQNSLFVSEGLVTTCAGEFAAFDLVIDLIAKQCDDEMVHRVCALVLADRWRSGNQHQTAPAGLIYGLTSGSLIVAARLMEQHIDDKLKMSDIARCVGLSRRQIERLFDRHVGMTPLQYYKGLRLNRAMDMVRLTKMPIFEIALACGFETASHFAKCFREKFDASPSSFRRPAAAVTLIER